MMLNMNIDKAMFVEATDQETFVAALKDKRRIIVVNIQKFWELKNAIQKAGGNFTDKRVAFLIDEVHRSNTDDVHQEMFSAFDELQDIFDENGGFITRGSTKKNLIVGFTATPSDRVLARFGEFHRGSNFNQLWKPFDTYTMKEAIADGYILDPTKHIIPVPAKMYFELPDGVLQLVTEAINSGKDEKIVFARSRFTRTPTDARLSLVSLSTVYYHRFMAKSVVRVRRCWPLPLSLLQSSIAKSSAVLWQRRQHPALLPSMLMHLSP